MLSMEERVDARLSHVEAAVAGLKQGQRKILEALLGKADRKDLESLASQESVQRLENRMGRLVEMLTVLLDRTAHLDTERT